MVITQNITLDFCDFDIYTCSTVEAKQGDTTRKIRAVLNNNGALYTPPAGASASFRCLKPDGCSCKYPAQINDDGSVTVELTEQTLAVKGRVKADITLTDAAGEILSTANFLIIVEEVPTGKAINSTNEYLELVATLKKADILLNAADGLAARMAIAEQDIADLKYIPIQVISAGNNVSPVELGATVDAVTVSWNLNRDPEAQTVDGTHVAPAARSLELTGLGMTKNRTFTVEAVDERGATDSRSTTVYFYNGVYSGVLSQGGVIDSAAILALTRKLQSGKSLTFTANAGAGEQIAYALPARYGTPVFSVGGFEGGFYKAATLDFTNASGYTESYDVWLSDNPGLGNTTVKVT